MLDTSTQRARLPRSSHDCRGDSTRFARVSKARSGDVSCSSSLLTTEDRAVFTPSSERLFFETRRNTLLFRHSPATEPSTQSKIYTRSAQEPFELFLPSQDRRSPSGSAAIAADPILSSRFRSVANHIRVAARSSQHLFSREGSVEKSHSLKYCAWWPVSFSPLRIPIAARGLTSRSPRPHCQTFIGGKMKNLPFPQSDISQMRPRRAAG